MCVLLGKSELKCGEQGARSKPEKKAARQWAMLVEDPGPARLALLKQNPASRELGGKPRKRDPETHWQREDDGGGKPAQARRSREWWGESKKRRCAGRLPPPPHSAPSPAPASTSRDPEPPTATTTFSPVEKTPDCSEITIGWGDRWMPPEKKKGRRQPSRRPWVSRRQQSSSDGHPADLSRDASGSCFLLTAAPTSAPQLRSAQQPKQKGDSSVSSLGGCKASLWLFQPLREKEVMGKIWSAHKDILGEKCTFMYKIAQAPRMRHYFSTA
nr:uncharacterized protein LOC105494341 isoform X2 [Macaca nemestrina]